MLEKKVSYVTFIILVCSLLLFACAELDLGGGDTDRDSEPASSTSDGDSDDTDTQSSGARDSEDSDSSDDSDDSDSFTTSPVGTPCTADNAVSKCGDVNLCVDGYCCDAVCDGPCTACGLPGKEGACTAVGAGENPDGECGLCSACNGDEESPACEPFAAGDDPMGECGPCRVCNGDAKDPDCVPAPYGEDPKDECDAEAAETCGSSGVCDGLGGCALYAEGAACSSPVCTDFDTASRLYRYSCDGKGVCTENADICGGYFCEVEINACQKTCEGNYDCVPGFTCENYACVIETPKEDGVICLNDDECENGVCADGVCCDTRCDGDCEACDLPGSEGECTAVDENTDPKNDCPPCFVCGADQNCAPVPEGEDFEQDCAASSDPNGCGASGTCDGRGACALLGEADVCGESSCSDNGGASSTLVELYCDGRGNCDERTGNCGAFLCADGTACADDCDDADTCIDGAMCEDGRCTASQPDGTPCREGSECESERCVDGVCCAEACDGPCERCDMPESEGACAAAADFTDPDNDCPVCTVCVDGECKNTEAGEDSADDCSVSAPGTCGYSGVCDGNGACAFAAEETVCGGACDGNDLSELYCDGEGVGRAHCSAVGETETCGGDLRCDPLLAACPESCLSSADCIEGTYCDDSGTCVGQNGRGDACESDLACASGHCANGVCCDTACDAICMSCAIVGSEGTCKSHPEGSDPDDDCAECNVCNGADTCVPLDGEIAPVGDCVDDSPCGHTGECVNGTCAVQPEGTVCDELLCEGDAVAPEVTLFQCDGEGTCQTIEARTCGGYRCADENTCLTACQDAEDCAASFSCNDSLCTSDNPNGTPCMLNTECENGNCVDGFCCDTACGGLCESCDIQGEEGTCALTPNGSWGTLPESGDSDCGVCEVCDGEGACRPVDARLYSGDPADPRNLCGDATEPSACGRTGACEDGAGICALYPVTAVCGAECPFPGNDLFLMHCNGEGECIADETSAPCDGNLNCAEDEVGCRDECLNQTHCTSDAWCTADGACEGKKLGGDPCEAAFECISGYCPTQDGVCCNSACDDLCESCDLEGSTGLCIAVPKGEDPDGECDDGKYCTLTDACNGDGACEHLGSPCNETDANDCNDCNESADSCIQPLGTVCGDDADDDCTRPDTCNATGICLANHVANDTPCNEDTNLCTYDICSGGSCVHPDSGNSDDDTLCDAQDNCPEVTNESQTDSDDDGVGDACDACPSDPTHTEGPCLQVWAAVNPADKAIEVMLEIKNLETAAFSMDDLSLRYWYTVDDTFDSQAINAYHVDASGSFPDGTANLVLSPESSVFHPVNRPNANYYMELRFTEGLTVPAAAGSVAGATGRMQLAWHTNPYTTFVYTNDYSNVTDTTSSPTERITLYSGSTLIWGTEP